MTPSEFVSAIESFDSFNNRAVLEPFELASDKNGTTQKAINEYRTSVIFRRGKQV
jgi:hypothetical protein